MPRRNARALTAGLLLLLLASPGAAAPATRTFATPEDAVKALADLVKAGDPKALVSLFGPAGADLIDSSAPETARRNRDVFLVAFAEGWSLQELAPDRRELVVGHEAWPFPVPLVRSAAGWSFDGEAGRQEVLARRIGRNELTVVGICQAYVRAQRAYAAQGRDGAPAGAYARRLRSTEGRHDGLYWPAQRGEPRSPLGDLVATAAKEGTDLSAAGARPTPFHGYYFRILEGQGPHATGGAKSYVADGRMTGGFAMVAWPATYDGTGVMTFLVGPDGAVLEQDLGPGTPTKAAAIARFDPDPSWRPVTP